MFETIAYLSEFKNTSYKIAHDARQIEINTESIPIKIETSTKMYTPF